MCFPDSVASFTLEINHHTRLHLSHYNPNQSKKFLFLGCAQHNHAFTFVGHGSTSGNFLHGLLLIFRDCVSVNPAIWDWLGGRPACHPEPSFFTSLGWMTDICCHTWHFDLIAWVLGAGDLNSGSYPFAVEALPIKYLPTMSKYR